VFPSQIHVKHGKHDGGKGKQQSIGPTNSLFGGRRRGKTMGREEDGDGDGMRRDALLEGMQQRRRHGDLASRTKRKVKKSNGAGTEKMERSYL